MNNNYARFLTFEETIKNLNKVSKKEDITKGGIPLCYDDDSIYVDTSEGHNLIIGGTGSGKTQSIILPKMYTSIQSGESMIVEDNKGEILSHFKDKLEENNYNIVVLNYRDFSGNKWNPLELPTKLYKEGNIDDAISLFENIANCLLVDNNNQDPFWINSARNLFVGSILYLLEENKEVTIDKVTNIIDKIDLKKLDYNSPARIFLKNIYEAPKDTKGSILSVFNSLIPFYTTRMQLLNNMQKTDFDLNNIVNGKTAIFIINNFEKNYITNLTPLFIEQIYYLAEKDNTNKTKINVVIDDFTNLNPIINFSIILSNARGFNMEFTILVDSLKKLFNIYQEIEFEHILLQFSRIIYLYSQDEFTVDYISKVCGNKNEKELLISPIELKTLNVFEAIILKSRMLPIKTTLLPYYRYPKDKI